MASSSRGATASPTEAFDGRPISAKKDPASGQRCQNTIRPGTGALEAAVISRRPADLSLCIASLIALAACHPNETGGGGGSTSSSGAVSTSNASSTSGSGGGGAGGATSSASTAGSGGAGGSASASSSSSASSSGGAGGAASSSSASSSNASSSSSSGTGGGGGGVVTVAWTQGIPSSANFLDIAGISAKTPNRLFIGGNFTGGSFAYAGTTLTNGPPHSAGYFLSMDGAGNPVSNAYFGNSSYNYTARLFATDAAANVFVSGQATGPNGNFMPAQKVGASPWLQEPGGINAGGDPYSYEITTDLAGNLLLNVGVPPGGVDFGGGLQMNPVILKLDATTGAFVWNKPSPGGSMHRDSAGNLFFLKIAATNLIQKFDASLAPIWTKSFSGSFSGSMAVGPSGEFGLAGTFTGAIDFGCGFLVSPANVTSFAVARLDATGNCLYSKRFDPGGYDVYRLRLGITAGGEVVVVSAITSSVDFGGGAVAPGTFVLKLGAAGAWVSSTSVPADQLYSAVDAQGAVYLVGSNFDVGMGPILGNVPGIAVAKLVP
jgi:hypothetical protein